MKKILLLLCIVFCSCSTHVLAQSIAHDGTVDSTFGINGIASVTNNWYNSSSGMTVLPNDEVVLLATFNDSINRGTNTTALVKLKQNGQIDSSFGINGVSVFTNPYLQTYYEGGEVTHDANERIIFVGTGYDSTISKGTGFAIYRTLPDGRPDSSFNKTGSALAGFGDSNNIVVYFAQQADGKFVVAGSSTDNFGIKKFIRFNTDGSIDSTFGIAGTGRIILNTDEGYFDGFCVQPDNKLLVSLDSLERLNTDGTLDSSFGRYGIVPLKGYMITAMSALPNGKILAGGSNSDFLLSRYNNNGTPDSSFGTNGFTYSAVNGYRVFTEYITLQPDNKIILAGLSYDPFTTIQILARYTENGILDSSFGTNGVVVYPLPCSRCSGMLSGLGLQSNGDIITGGNTEDGEAIFAVRYIAHPNKLSIANITNTPSFISLYPNPTSGKFTLSALNLYGTTSIAVCDITGKTLFTTQHDFTSSATKKLDLSAYPTGMYFVKVTGSNSIVKIVKLLKQ